MKYYWSYYNDKFYKETELETAYNDLLAIEAIEDVNGFDGWLKDCKSGLSDSIFEISEKVYNQRSNRDEINRKFYLDSLYDGFAVDVAESMNNYALLYEGNEICEIELCDVFPLLHSYFDRVVYIGDDEAVKLWDSLVNKYRIGNV